MRLKRRNILESNGTQMEVMNGNKQMPSKEDEKNLQKIF